MEKLTFKKYWESKRQLISAADETPRTQSEHYLQKYCKIPVLESDGTNDGQYISFKPNDKITIFWEHHDLMNPTATKIVLVNNQDEEVEHIPRWNNKKMGTWVEKNTKRIDPYE